MFYVIRHSYSRMEVAGLLGKTQLISDKEMITMSFIHVHTFDSYFSIQWSQLVNIFSHFASRSLVFFPPKTGSLSCTQSIINCQYVSTVTNLLVLVTLTHGVEKSIMVFLSGSRLVAIGTR